MKSIVISSCLIKPSQIGAKGFLYPVDDSTGVFIRKGTKVEQLNYISTEKYHDWRAIAVSNSLIEGAAISDGIGVYWIQRKNLRE